MITRLLSRCLQTKSFPFLLIRKSNHCHFSKLSTANITRKKYFSTTSESDHDEIQLEELLDTNKKYDIKEMLYPNSLYDPVIHEINNCTTLSELTKFIENSANLEKHQLCQLVLMLWNHVKLFKEPQSLASLDNLFSRASQLSHEMTGDELSCCYVYLNKLGLSIRTMESMTDKILEHIQKDDFSLVAMSRFTVALNSEKGLYSAILEAQLLPQINKALDTCDNADDFHLITICLNNISHIVPMSLLDKFRAKVEWFLQEGLLNETTSTCIFKIINFLNYPHWSWRNAKLLRQLLLELEDNIKFFDTRDLLTISRAFHSQLESARLVPRLVVRAQTLVNETPSVELLSLAVLSTTPKQRSQITQELKEFLADYQITSNQSSEMLQIVFKILRLLKISDLSLCESYWTKVINEVYGTKEQNLIYRLSKYVHKYMFFNNNLGGTYRHLEFENSMIEMLLFECKKSVIPRNFATFSSFIIAYGDGSGSRLIPQFIVNKIEKLHEQFTIKDCIQISRGLQVLQEMRFRDAPHQLEDQIDSINYSLGKCSERHLRREDLHLSEMNGIIRAYNSRKASRDTYLFHEMMKFYDTKNKLELNSRSLRDIVYNLQFCNFRMDPACDQFVDYVLLNWDHVTGDTVEKVLTCCYNFSYFPEKPEFLEQCSEIIIRDFNFMSGLAIVQALLALIFYKSCPQQLITKVFSGEFIKRLEQEIEMCYSRNTYPQRVMNQFMQLNRAVCLDCPEVNVKWFQQTFIEAQASKQVVIHSRLHNDVKNLLTTIVKSPDLLKINRITPYGYRVDFEIHIDQYNRFVRPIPEDYQHINFLPKVNKIAILLLSNKVFCENDVNRLKGSELLRMRHLEMMGYRVVHVKIHDLNKLYKNVTAKLKHLRKLIQLTT